MTEVTLYSPTGSEIQGTYEKVPGAADVFFSMEEGSLSYEHTGNGTKMFWEGSTTQEIDDVALFTDTDGHDWLLHHLIPAHDGEATALSAATVNLCREELIVGDAIVAARELHRAIGRISLVEAGRVQRVVENLAERYAAAKEAAIEAIQKELAAR